MISPPHMAQLSRSDNLTALLVLLLYIAYDLRRLQRGLRSDDMLEQWRLIDDALGEEIKTQRGLEPKVSADGLSEDLLAPGPIGSSRTMIPLRRCAARPRVSSR